MKKKLKRIWVLPEDAKLLKQEAVNNDLKIYEMFNKKIGGKNKKFDHRLF